jgi:hypothetical protein
MVKGQVGDPSGKLLAGARVHAEIVREYYTDPSTSDCTRWYGRNVTTGQRARIAELVVDV